MKKLLYFIILYCFSFSSLFAGGIIDDMKNFYNKYGGNMNTNNARSIQGQKAGYYTMGSLQARAPIKNINPINIQLPSIRSGCGGIDIFTGGFTFINKDQFIAFARSVMQNALGYAFQLSLQSLSPVMSSIMTRLQQWANEINQFNMNSCKTAQNLVNGAAGVLNAGITTACETMSNSSGTATDMVAAVLRCQNPNVLNEEVNKQSPSNRTANINIIWQALRDAGYVDALGTEMAEDLMFLMGTIIVKIENGVGTIQRINPGIWVDSTLDTILYGGGLLTWQCDETQLCLNPVQRTSNKLISEEDAFQPKIARILESIENKIRNFSNSEELTNEEENLIKMTNFPVLRIITTSAQGGGFATINSNVIAEITARDILIKFAEEISDTALESISRFKSASSNENEIKEVEKNIQAVKRYLQEKSLENKDSLERAISIISMSEAFDKKLSEDWASRMRGTLNFSNQLQNK